MSSSQQQGNRRRRQRNHHHPPPPPSSSLMGNLATAAVVAYGTYRVAGWAWDTIWNDNDYENNNSGNGSYRMPAQTGRTQQQTQQQQQQRRRRWDLRRDRLVQCREECRKTLQKFLPAIRSQIEDRTDVSQETARLKQIRARDKKKKNKMKKNNNAVDDNSGAAAATVDDDDDDERAELWETIKVRAVTRLVVTAYANTLMFLVLTVQVNLVAGRLFQNDDNTTANDKEAHRLVLTRTYQYFLDQGLDRLMSAVEDAVQDALDPNRGWNVLEGPMSMALEQPVLESALENIRGTVERQRQRQRRNGGSRTSATRSSTTYRTAATTTNGRTLFRFLMPAAAYQGCSSSNNNSHGCEEEQQQQQQGVNANANANEVANWIQDETWDLLESSVFRDAERDCLDTTFAMMRDLHWGRMFCADKNGNEDEKNEEEKKEQQQQQQQEDGKVKSLKTQPMASVLTQLKKTSNSFYNSQQQQEPLLHANAAGGVAVYSSASYAIQMEGLPAVLELQDVSFN